MALEKKLFAIAPQLFLADGGAAGKVTVTDACLFKVKQKVEVAGTALPQLNLEVKRVISNTEMFLGKIGQPISDRADLSLYTTAAASFVFTAEQKRPSIPFEESTRAVYEEEPTVAFRNFLVDKLGKGYSVDNPFPVQLSDGSINIGTVNAELEVQLSHQDNVPDAGDIADSVQIGDGTEILQILPDGSIGTTPVIPSTATPTTESPVATSEVEISPIAGQTFIILSPTTAGDYHFRLATGVTTDSVPFTRRQPAIISDWAGSVFVRKASGSGAIEVTQG